MVYKDFEEWDQDKQNSAWITIYQTSRTESAVDQHYMHELRTLVRILAHTYMYKKRALLAR